MQVQKRDGSREDMSFDKITAKISKLCDNLNRKYVNPVLIAQKTIAEIYDGIKTTELDLQSAKICANLCTTHYDYSKLAANILISNLHKSIQSNYSIVLDQLYNNYVCTIQPDITSLQMI